MPASCDSRVAFAAIYPDEQGTTCAAFLREAAAVVARLGVWIEGVMIENARNDVDSRAFQDALVAIGARHKPTPAFAPQVDGKSERLNRNVQRSDEPVLSGIGPGASRRSG